MRRNYQKQISTPYSFLTGDKALHRACRVAAGKHKFLLSICVNLHSLRHITRVSVLGAILVGLRTDTPYAYICIFNVSSYQICFLK